MAELPTGTVTFLFTDIEGSTRLLHQLGDRFTAALGDHAEILRGAITEGDGIELGTEGDSFFAVFASPRAAVQAAVEAQRRLATHSWPDGAALPVRMGLHSGEGALGVKNYVGIDVNRAARIAAAAHGGQIIVSDATRALVEQTLPGGTTLRDLGMHRLKDIVHAEHLYDLVIEGLPADFPVPRTLDARPNNLPPPLTSFVGREHEIAEIKRLLLRSRLLTLTGPGGTGKTRLALQAAAEILSEFADGVFFADLAPVTDHVLVASAVAQAVGIPEQAGRPILEAMKDHLRDKELLLIADNFEQVVDAASVVEELLMAASKIKILVTSRSVLSVPGEHEFAVPPLAPPDPERLPDLVSLRRIDAVRLFTDRARAVQPRFEVTEDNASAVAAITARLDGLPLAIELAATRTKVLSPQQILPRLQQRLSILTSGARTLPDRQRTLRAAIAWSYDLLDSEERRLFARLAAFTGGWDLEAAEVVCDPQDIGLDVLDGMSSLVDKSLVGRTESADGRVHFFMLETIREFGQEQLKELGDLDVTCRRHAQYFLDLVMEAESHLTAKDQGEWLDRLDQEHPNIRAALRSAVELKDADRAQTMAGALWRFWQQRGHLDEARRWFDEILAMPSRSAPSPARAKALLGAGGVAWWQKDREAAGTYYEEAVAIEREIGDDERLAEALYNLAFVVAGSDIHSASRLLEESLNLFRKVESEAGVAQVLAMLVIRDAEAGAWDRVIAKLEETTGIWRRLGDRLHLAFDLVWLAFAYGRVRRGSDARGTALEALELFCQADNPTGVGIVFSDLAFLATWEGRHENAIRLAGAAEAVRRGTGGPPGGFAGILDDDPREEACAYLSKEAAQRAWEEGLGMSLDEAVAFARKAGPVTSQ
jgi:predicted ATPase/class 3 adenylate cyclase